MQSNKLYQKYYNEVVVLLKTGLRISELCGLTVKDLALQNRSVNIDLQILRATEIGYYVDLPKTNKVSASFP